MKVIYKYPLSDISTVLIVPFTAQLLTVQYDPQGQLCAWFLHEPVEGMEAKFEFLVQGTGWEITEPINNYDGVWTGGFDYYTTVKQGGYVWHVFMRQLFE